MRSIIHEAHGPLPLKKADLPGETAWLCRCGLSAALPFCDGSHKKTLDEKPGVMYEYQRDAEGVLSRRETGPAPTAATLEPSAGRAP